MRRPGSQTAHPSESQLPAGRVSRGVDALLSFGNKRAQVAAADVCLDHDAALAVVAADLVRPFAHLKPGQLPSGINAGPVGDDTAARGRQDVRGGSRSRRATGEWEAFEPSRFWRRCSGRRTISGKRLSPSKTRPASRPPNGDCYHLLDIGDRQPIARDGRPVDLHLMNRKAESFVRSSRRPHRARSAGCGRWRRHSVAYRAKSIAIDFHGHIASHPGNELVKAHLNRLRELVVVSWKLLEGFFHPLQPGRFSAPRGLAMASAV